MRIKLHSIRFKMTVILVFIVGWIILLTWLLNIAFAEKYYISYEEKELVTSFQRSRSAFQKNDDLIAVKEELYDIVERTSTKMMVTGPGTSPYGYGQAVIHTNIPENTDLYDSTLTRLDRIKTRMIMAQIKYSDESVAPTYGDKKILTLEKEGYYLERNLGDEGNIRLTGVVNDTYYVSLQVPIEAIRSSVQINSRLLTYIGMIGLFFGSLVMFLYASSFARPIKKMALAANQMASLDFDTKIEASGDDELGELGHSMNQMSEKLESAIGDLKAANLKLKQDIEKKEEIDEMRKEFLSHVSHELKTPIALIQGYAEGLKENINDDEDSRDFYCEVISDEAKKMNKMVKRILMLNQIEFGNDQISMQRFDICQMIQNKINSSQILFEKKNVKVIFQEKSPVYVWADELMIEEVFGNYLSNALNHVYENGTVRVSFETIDDSLRVHVYNDGDCIPEEELDKLWIKFYKVDKARTRKYGGNGIGLSIVAAAMNAHGKAYGVKNKEDGVDFYFDLDRKN